MPNDRDPELNRVATNQTLVAHWWLVSVLESNQWKPERLLILDAAMPTLFWCERSRVIGPVMARVIGPVMGHVIGHVDCTTALWIH